MSSRAQYVPGPAAGAEVRKDGDKWTLVLVRELHHPPQKVWKALTDPASLREWRHSTPMATWVRSAHGEAHSRRSNCAGFRDESDGR
jgi:uncharacterized protein YndB with AHSA1/START domain